MTETQNRDAWERARTVAAIVIQPHLKKGSKITAKQLLPLPWDKKEKRRGDMPPELTAEEKRKRFEELAQK